MSGNSLGPNPLSYVGVLPNNPPNIIRANRAPTTRDINANIGDEWEDFSVYPSDFYKLCSLKLGIAVWVLFANGSSNFNVINPDSGGSILPLLGAVTITGFPVGTANLKNIKTFNGGGAGNILEMQDLGNLSRYVVGVSANESQFTSIQTAINTAVADGHDAANPAVVYITPGTYIENLSLKSGVFLAGLGFSGTMMTVLIQGAAVLNVPPGTNTFSAWGISFSTAGAAFPAFSLQGANNVTLNLTNCSFIGLSGTAYENISSGNSIIAHVDNSYSAGAGQKVLNLAGSQESFFNCQSTFTDTKSTFTNNKCSFFDSVLTDSITLTGSNPLFFNTFVVSHAFPATNFEAFAVDATSQLGMIDCFLDTSSPTGFSVTGTGQVGYNVITAAQPFDPALTIQGFATFTGNLSFDGGATTIASNGQLIIGNTVSGRPTINTLTAGTGISIINGPGTITINGTGGGLSWSDEVANFSAVSNNGYFIAGNAIASLPATPTNGDVIVFIVDGAFTVTVTASAGKTIKIGPVTSAAAGTAANTANGDTLTLVYRSTNTRWEAESYVGAWIVT